MSARMKNNSCPTPPSLVARLALLIALLLALPALAPAATKTWDGSASGLWASGANWVGGVAPVAGDDLVFPSGALRLANTNNFAAGTSFRTITISGVNYQLHGNRVQLTGDGGGEVMEFNPVVNGTSTAYFDITLAGVAGDRKFQGGTGGIGNILQVAGDVDLNGHTLQSYRTMRWAGIISGNGDVTVLSGETTFSGGSANTYSGETRVSLANIVLLKNAGVTAVPGRLVASGGSIEWGASHQVSNGAEIGLGNGSAELNGHSETVSVVKVSDTGAINGGTLTVAGDLRFQDGHNTLRGSGAVSFPSGTHHLIATNSTNDISLELTGAGNLIQEGGVSQGSEVHLFAANTFTGTYSLSNTVLYPRHANALGSGPAGTFVLRPAGTFNNASIVLLTNMVIANEVLVASSPGKFSLGTLASQDGTARWSGNIILSDSGATFTTIDTGDVLILDGVISGSGGVLVSPDDTGKVVFSGASPNTYTGATTVDEQGRLELNKTTGPAVPGNLRLSDNVNDDPNDGVVLLGHQQIGDDATITIFTGSRFLLNGFNETLGNIDLLGQSGFVLGGGTLTLNGDLRKFSQQTFNITGPGRLHLSPFVEHVFNIDENPGSNELLISCEVSGAGSILKTGSRSLRLAAANTFAGNLTVGEGTVELLHSLALGAATAGTIVSNGATLLLAQDGLNIAGEPLELRGHGVSSGGALRALGTVLWSGPIEVTEFGSVAVAANETLTLSGAITAPEQLWKRGDGRMTLSGAADNSFAGGFVLRDGTLDLAKTAGAVAVSGFIYVGDSETAEEELCRVLGDGQFHPGTHLIVPPTGRLRMNGHSATVRRLSSYETLDGGIIELGGATLTVEEDGVSEWGGTITGAGGVVKRGIGDLRFYTDNTYTGPTLVQQGVLRVRGQQPQSPVTVQSGATLTGDGTVGHLTVNNGGMLSPGYFFGTVASLTCSNLVMQPGSTNRTRIIGNSAHTRMNVRGSVTLNQPVLFLDENVPGNPPKPYLPEVGEEIIPIVNDGVEAVTGAFVGMPGGQFTGYAGLQWTVSYANDVVLRLLSQGLASGTTSGSNYLDAQISGGNGDAFLDPNECAQLRLPFFNDTSSNLPPFTAFLECDVPGVTVHQLMTSYPALAPGQGAYGSNSFQITTPSDLFCGSNLPVRLVIQMPGITTYAVATSVFVGAPEAAARFDATEVPQPIDDGVAVESTLNVDDFPGWLARVEVEVHAAHALSSDLQLTLVAPDGMEFQLARGAGAGANYGASCADGQRTRFSMTGAQHVSAAVAPFTGTFRPDSNLNLLRSRSGGDVAGKWTLRILDEAHVNTGTLLCWSLFLSPTTCTDGGGACAVCPGLVEGQLNTDDQAITQFVGALNKPSIAYVLDDCYGPETGTRHVDLHSYSNHLATAVCVTATLTTECTNYLDRIYAAAFAGGFDASSVCDGFLGGSGYAVSDDLMRKFQFIVPPHTNVQIAVTTVQENEGCKGYSLLVDGVGLCPVALNITALATNVMRLDWPEHAAGYELQRTPAFAPTTWSNVLTPPVKMGSRFVVTNEVADPNGFYRLSKP